MNVHEAEPIAGLLDEAGSASVADGAQPDVVVFSTVRENADNRLGGNLDYLKPVEERAPHATLRPLRRRLSVRLRDNLVGQVFPGT